MATLEYIGRTRLLTLLPVHFLLLLLIHMHLFFIHVLIHHASGPWSHLTHLHSSTLSRLASTFLETHLQSITQIFNAHLLFLHRGTTNMLSLLIHFLAHSASLFQKDGCSSPPIRIVSKKWKAHVPYLHNSFWSLPSPSCSPCPRQLSPFFIIIIILPLSFFLTVTPSSSHLPVLLTLRNPTCVSLPPSTVL